MASHDRLLAAYRYSQSFVENLAGTLSPADAITALFEIVEFIRTSTQLIRVTVDDEADAFTIFETLNDRNAHLTVADLLKNFLFGKSGEFVEETKDHWRTMQGALGALGGKRDKSVVYIRQLWGSMHGLVRETELFRDIKSRVTDETEACELASQIADQATDYVAVLNPSHEMWDGKGTSAKAALETFNKLRVERIRPLLLAILRMFDDKEVSKSLVYLRSAVVRIITTTGINGTVEEKLFETAVGVHDGTIKKTTQLAKAMETIVPIDTVFQAQFAAMNVTKAQLARFYLQEIQDSATDQENDGRVTDRDEKKVDLEHIIPSAPSERETHWKHLSRDVGESLYRRLGNQTLIRRKDNGALGGKPYSVKKPVYATTVGLPLTSAIARDYPNEFGEAEVNARQSRLAELAVATWPITV